MLFFRLLVHLLPRAIAWQVTVDKTLRRFLDALAKSPADARDFIDAVWLDIFPKTTRELAAWEKEHGIVAAGTEAERRLQLAAAWSAQGGQSPRYLEDVLRAAGFDVHVYEWWELPVTIPRTKRDPRNYTDVARVGTVQCMPADMAGVHCCTANDAPPPDPLPGGVELWDLYPECNRWLVNDVGYLVNLTLTREAPPPVPNDPAYWPYFIYIAGTDVDTRADVPAARRDEFQRLLLKLRPDQQWVVTYVNYV
jgi:uncharacterized protein YmfQ (DUF2313 family)